MTHYDSYPYPDPEQYTAAEARQLHTNFAPRADTWTTFFPDEREPSPKRALVIGCGVFEAIAVAVQAPTIKVLGIDASAKVIKLAREKAGRLDNLTLAQIDFMEADLALAFAPFDFILASGVMHHVKDANGFTRRMRKLIAPSGAACVMVYGDIERAVIPSFCEVLRTLGVTANAEGIAFVKALIDQMPFQHPVKRFYRKWRDSDNQIADMFLNPYFRQYAADDLVHLLGRHGFAHDGWIDRATDLADYEFGGFTRNMLALPEATRARIGQILNADDGRIVGLFRPV